MSKHDKPKILIYDIEISPCTGWFWQTGQQYVGEHNVLESPKIICIAYQWLGKKRIETLAWDENQDDKEMVIKFRKIALEADYIVGHNGDQFDKKMINSRLAYHGEHTLMNIETEDTLKQVRRQFRLPSYKLGYLVQFFKCGGKLSTSNTLWKDVVFAKNKAALKYMIKYCKNDVRILSELYAKLFDIVQHKFNLSVLRDDPDVCPSCGTRDIVRHGIRYTKSGAFQRFRCKRHHVFRNGVSVIQANKQLLKR